MASARVRAPRGRECGREGAQAGGRAGARAGGAKADEREGGLVDRQPVALAHDLRGPAGPMWE
jgi:hypothetical protein